MGKTVWSWTWKQKHWGEEGMGQQSRSEWWNKADEGQLTVKTQINLRAEARNWKFKLVG